MGFVRLMIPLMIVALMVVATECTTMTCKYVYTSLEPCKNYLQYGGSLPDSCCTGVQSLYQEAQTTVDRQKICSCLKTAYATFRPINTDAAATLLTKCHVYTSYKITPSINCNSVT